MNESTIDVATLEAATRLINELRIIQSNFGSDEIRITFRRGDGRLGGRIVWDGKEGSFFVDFALYGQ